MHVGPSLPAAWPCRVETSEPFICICTIMTATGCRRRWKKTRSDLASQTSRTWSRSAMSSPSIVRASEDRASLQRRYDFQDEARRLYREHGAREKSATAMPSCGRSKRPACRLMRAMSGFRSQRRRTIPWRSMPHHGMTPAYLRHVAFRAGAYKRPARAISWSAISRAGPSATNI